MLEFWIARRPQSLYDFGVLIQSEPPAYLSAVHIGQITVKQYQFDILSFSSFKS